MLSAEDELYPVYYAIKTFSPYQGKPARILHSSDPLVIRGIILNGKVMALVNLTQDKRSVRYGDTEYTLAPWEIRLNALHSS